MGQITILTLLSMLAIDIEGGHIRTTESPPPSGMFNASIGLRIDNRSLPEHIVAPPGKLTLFADFEHATDSEIDIYLINRSPYRLAFQTQDHDPFVKLEASFTDGHWERAQTHAFSWCGNSYFPSPRLRPGEHFKFKGYRPQNDTPCKVRYGLYRDFAYIVDETTTQTNYRLMNMPGFPIANIKSNCGPGFAQKQVIHRAKSDPLAPSFGDFEETKALALGDRNVLTSNMGREQAIEHLWRFNTKESLNLIKQLLQHTDERVRFAAMRSLSILGRQMEDAEKHYQACLKNEDPRLLEAALFAQTMTRPFDASVRDYAVGLTSHEDLRVRIMALKLAGYGCKQNEESKAILGALRHNMDARVQEAFESVAFPSECTNRRYGPAATSTDP